MPKPFAPPHGWSRNGKTFTPDPDDVKSKDLYPAMFSRHADAYAARLEQIMSRREARSRERVLELLDAKPGMRVLDLACGPGTLSARIAAQVAPVGEVIGIDLAVGMIDAARAAGIRHARFEVMDMEHLGFPDQCFDAAACGHGLQFTSDLVRTMTEVRRVLKPGSRFAASVPIIGSSDPVLSALNEVAKRWLPPEAEAVDQTATRAVVSDAAQFRAAALTAGFESADVELIEERSRWRSTDHFVSTSASWWSCASRLDQVAPATREAFIQDAISTLRKQHVGEFETSGRSHVIVAVAG